MAFWNRVKSAGRRFAANSKGNLSIVLGVAIIPLALAGGSAMDYERAITAKTHLQASLDAAALYAGQLGAVDNATLTAQSQPYLNQNFAFGDNGKLQNYSVVNNGTSITATATVTLNTYFMNIVGQNTMSVLGSSTVVKQGTNLEVSLVLDNTNSMNSANPKTGNTAIHDAIAAADLFVQMVPPGVTGTTYVKIAAVPYNNSVNMGSAAMANWVRGPILPTPTTNVIPGYQNYTFSTMPSLSANYVVGNWGSYGQSCNNYPSNSACQLTLPITNCVTERTGLQATTDAPIHNGLIVAAPMGRAYQPSDNGCTVTAVVPLSLTAAPLKTAIDGMIASNSTAGQVGIAWGWYMLSPNLDLWSGNSTWSSTSTPGSYTLDPLSPQFNSSTPILNQVHKVMILMTDGEYNSAMCNGVITGNDTAMGTFSDPYYGSVIGTGYPSEHVNCKPTNGDVYTQSNAMCTAIKNSGIEVYVVTFQLDTNQPKRVALTQNCATDASHVIDADATSPQAAYTQIANRLNTMRIAQ